MLLIYFNNDRIFTYSNNSLLVCGWIIETNSFHVLCFISITTLMLMLTCHVMTTDNKEVTIYVPNSFILRTPSLWSQYRRQTAPSFLGTITVPSLHQMYLHMDLSFRSVFAFLSKNAVVGLSDARMYTLVSPSKPKSLSLMATSFAACRQVLLRPSRKDTMIAASAAARVARTLQGRYTMFFFYTHWLCSRFFVVMILRTFSLFP